MWKAKGWWSEEERAAQATFHSGAETDKPPFQSMPSLASCPDHLDSRTAQDGRAELVAACLPTGTSLPALWTGITGRQEAQNFFPPRVDPGSHRPSIKTKMKLVLVQLMLV